MIARLSPHLLGRLHQHAHKWRLEIEESFETETSLISFVSRQGQSLVLKIVKQPGDEWNAGKFSAPSMVRASCECTNTRPVRCCLSACGQAPRFPASTTM